MALSHLVPKYTSLGLSSGRELEKDGLYSLWEQRGAGKRVKNTSERGVQVAKGSERGLPQVTRLRAKIFDEEPNDML